jgi:hypothetical protein
MSLNSGMGRGFLKLTFCLFCYISIAEVLVWTPVSPVEHLRCVLVAALEWHMAALCGQLANASSRK